MSSRARAYLELARPPNLFTAAGDVVAGYLLVTRGISVEWRTVSLLVAASVALYAGGVVLNDYFDRDVDAVERPERAIPSGRVSPESALTFGAALLVAGVLFGAPLGTASLLVALVLAGAIVLYDARGKRIPYVGGVNMGACRFLNMMLGASAAPVETPEVLVWFALPAATIVGGYIVAVTILSTGEVWGGNRAVAGATFAAIVVVCLGVVWMGWTDRLRDRSYLAFLWLFALATLPVVGRVIGNPTGPNVGRAIKFCVLSLLLLDASFAAGAAGWLWGLGLAALILPSVLVARFFAVT